jgi:MFS family permease
VSAAGTFVADLRIVLRGSDFRRLFSTRLVSQASDGAFQAGLASLFFFSPQRAATATGVATAFGVAVLPYTLVGPFAGVLLDRWRRRQVLLVANAVRGVMVVGVAALVLGGVVGPLLYAVVLACVSVNRFFLAGLGACLPHVVPRHELVMANAVSPTSGTLVAMAGGGLGYGLRLLVGAGDRADGAVLLLAAGAYLTSSLLARRMHPDLLGPEGVATRVGWSGIGAALVGVARGLADGARHVRTRRRAFRALATIGVHRFAYGIATVASLLLCRNRLNDPADVEAGLRLLAAVVAVTGAGYAVAALLTPVGTRRMGAPAWIVSCLCLAALTNGALGVTLSVWLLLGGAFFLGLAAQGAKICVDAIVQDDVEDGYLGRVFSFYDVVFNAAFVAAAACAATLLPADGYSSVVYAGIAGLYLVTALAYGSRSRFAPVRVGAG